MGEQLGKLVVPKSAAAAPPSSPVAGQVWFDTTANLLRCWSGAAWVPVMDFGIVSTLPTGTIPKGAACSFKAALGVYWRLLYTEEETYPWAKVGGPPLFAAYTAAETLSTTSTTAVATNAPSLTMPAVKMEAEIAWGCKTATTSAASEQARLELFVAAVAKDWTTMAGAGGATIAPLYTSRLETLASGVVVQARYLTINAGTATFYSPYVSVDPKRVG